MNYPGGYARSREDDERELNNRLADHMHREGESLENVCRFLRTAEVLPRKTSFSLSLGTLEHWLGHGGWEPEVLYAFCERIGFSTWDAAQAIHALPRDLRASVDTRIQAASILSLQRYLESKQWLTPIDLPTPPKILESVIERLDAAVSPDYEIIEDVQKRGSVHRQPYHTYLIFRPVSNLRPGLGSAIDLRRRVEDSLRNIPEAVRVYGHWEPSMELKPPEFKENEILIIESYFDNRPLIQREVQAEVRRSLSPVILLGVYYSGVKDVIIVLHKKLGWAAIDVSRYIGELVYDAGPFRSDLELQNMIFWMLAANRLGQPLVLTVDDYQAVTEVGEWRPKGRLNATAVLLTLDGDMLDYAAYRVASSKLGPASLVREVQTEAATIRAELAVAQDELVCIGRALLRSVPFDNPSHKAKDDNDGRRKLWGQRRCNVRQVLRASGCDCEQTSEDTAMTHGALTVAALQQIATQRRALRARVEESGLYLNEIEEFEVAVDAYAQVLGRLNIDDDLGSLATSESRNLIRKVQLKDDGLGVLKVIGNTREPGEGELLATWHHAGLPSVRPMTWGYVQVRDGKSSRTAMYLLTESTRSPPAAKTQDAGPATRPSQRIDCASPPLSCCTYSCIAQPHLGRSAETTSKLDSAASTEQ